MKTHLYFWGFLLLGLLWLYAGESKLGLLIGIIMMIVFWLFLQSVAGIKIFSRLKSLQSRFVRFLSPPEIQSADTASYRPIAPRFFIAGIRPVAFLLIANGKILILRLNWETKVFEPGGWDYHTSEDDIDEIETKEEFIQWVEVMRARDIKGEYDWNERYRKMIQGEPALYELYRRMNVIEDKAVAQGRKLTPEEQEWLYQTRFKTFSMFKERFEMGQPWSEYL